MKHTDIDPGDANHPCWSSQAGTDSAGADDNPAAQPACTCQSGALPSARDRYFLAAVRQRMGAPAPLKTEA